MLTPLQKQAFVLLKVLYGYLPDFPVGYDSEYKRLTRKKSKWAYLIDGSFIISSFGMAFADVYVIYTHAFIKPRKRFGFNQIFAMSFYCNFAFIVGSIAIMFLYNIDQWISGINNIYLTEETLTES